MDMPPTRTATLQHLRHLGWRVLLPFYVDDRLSLKLPQGYVMPGWVAGEELEMSHLCEVCRNHADTPQGRLCFSHMLEYLKGLGL